MYMLFLVFAWSLCLLSVQSYKILSVFPVPSRSHYAAMKVVMLKLAEKGHQVSVYSPYVQPEPVANFRDFNMADCLLSKDTRNVVVDNMNNLMRSPLKRFIFVGTKSNVSVESITECQPLQQLLQSNESFDLLIIESCTYDTILLLAHKFRVPFISFMPNNMLPWHVDRMGNPSNPSYVPTAASDYLAPMDFWQRVHNSAMFVIGLALHNYIILKQNDETVKSILGADSSSLHDIACQTALFFAYTHSSLNHVAPLVPGIVEIGGAHIEPAKPIPVVRFL